jgi:DUF4097 and DUF4098 domain-containing protein YvlB
MPRLNFIAALAVIALAAAPAYAGNAVQEEMHQRYEAGGGVRVSLKNLNGDVRLEGWEEKVIDVTAVKSASSNERLGDVTVHFEFEKNHLRIDTDYEDRNWDHGDGHVSVDFVIRVPRGARIDAIELVNGDVVVRDVQGDVEASSVNGQVTGMALGGDIELSAVNGEVVLFAAPRARSIRMNSVNGSLDLILPREMDADLEVSTLHGVIRAADGFVVDDDHGMGSSLKGTLGRGGVKVELSTVNGSIDIRREGDEESRGG